MRIVGGSIRGNGAAAPPRTAPVPAMYVCICNALTERRVRQAVRDHRPDSVAAVYAACGVAPRCGKCAGMIAEILEEETAPALRLAAE